jgi:demethylmenaquinone methyltransferase/2-methoxy-6-polyprenyl-1,4-benzoquinol methylase
MSLAIQQMFDAISARYDLANRVLSLGIDPSWRRSALRLLAPRPGATVLDVATGTGDLAIALSQAVGITGRVVGVDLAAGMLRLAPAKAAAVRRRAAMAALGWIQGDALALPLASASFDAATMAFGIRNTDDPLGALCELRRVVKRGGRIVILEFGQPRDRLFAPLYQLYSRHVMPRIGGLLTGAAAAYSYLPRTAAAFPCGTAFAAWMREAGLARIVVRPLFLGVAWLYRGEVL